MPDLARQRGRPIRIAALDECEKELAALAAMGGRMIASGDSDYPPALRAIDSSPPLLAVCGNVAALKRPVVAMVGSRNASAAGLAFCERLTRDLGAAGFVVASGLARGIDARAHRSALGNGTIAALAGGLDRIYPAEHIPLAREILECGAIISEMPMGYEPRGRDFPRRNRIVSGLSLGVVVIEAARKSGSLITARFASEQGREVFAVPGSPLDPRAEGANGLLREGATLCTRAADIIDALTPLIESGPLRTDLFENISAESDEPLWDELDIEYGVPPRTQAGHEMDEPGPPLPVNGARRSPSPAGVTHEMILGLLGPAPVTLDDLARASGAPVASVRAMLVDMELSGRIERHGGGLVSLLPETPGDTGGAVQPIPGG